MKLLDLLFRKKDNEENIENSLALKSMGSSRMLELFSNDPRGFKVAFDEARNRVIAPAQKYVSEHPGTKLTAKLIDDLYFDRK